MNQTLSAAPAPVAAPTLAKVIILAFMMVIGWPLAEWMRPTTRLAELRPRIHLSQQIPTQFGDWQEDKSLAPLLPNPELQAKLDVLYSEVLARTYINAKGERVMLSIAYGSDQSSEATAVHRPEFCYSAQGFRVSNEGLGSVVLPRGELRVQRLVARMPPRNEPITYWVTLDEVATLPGLGRKLQQLRYGLHGQIADGMLVRVSSFGADNRAAYALQDQFVRQLHDVLPSNLKARYFGS